MPGGTGPRGENLGGVRPLFSVWRIKDERHRSWRRLRPGSTGSFRLVSYCGSASSGNFLSLKLIEVDSCLSIKACMPWGIGG